MELQRHREQCQEKGYAVLNTNNKPTYKIEWLTMDMYIPQTNSSDPGSTLGKGVRAQICIRVVGSGDPAGPSGKMRIIENG